MAHSLVLAELSYRMWDMSDLLINTSDVPQPLPWLRPGVAVEIKQRVRAIATAKDINGLLNAP